MSVPPPKDPMDEEFFIFCAPEDGNRICGRIVDFVFI